METNPNKRSTSEVGHAKNVAQFSKLIAFCDNYVEYNPPNPLIYRQETKDFYYRCADAISLVHECKNGEDILINRRQYDFQALDSLATRIVSLLEVATNDSKIVADARTILRKIRGEAPRPSTQDNLPGQEVTPPRSNSQQSYDKLLDHFVALVDLVRQVTGYLPNEPDLSVSSLQAYRDKLHASNKAVIVAAAQLAKARHERNELLYDPLQGLLQRAKLIKIYIKGLYGAASPQYEEVKAIRFRKD